MTLFSESCVQVGPPVKLGDDGFDAARVVPILGGTVTGPSLNGRFLPGGADEQRIRADGLTRIRARYLIETEQGGLVRVSSQGLRHGPPEVMAALLRGEPVDPAQVWFRAVIRLETADKTQDTLNFDMWLATG